jgi:hypothetical protein
MILEAEKSGFGVEKTSSRDAGRSVLRTGLIGVKREPQLAAFSALKKPDHLRRGKATHCVYDIRHTADSIALTSRCMTLGTTLYDIRHSVEKE